MQHAKLAAEVLVGLLCLTPVLAVWFYCVSYAHTLGKTNALLSFHSDEYKDKRKTDTPN